MTPPDGTNTITETSILRTSGTVPARDKNTLAEKVRSNGSTSSNFNYTSSYYAVSKMSKHYTLDSIKYSGTRDDNFEERLEYFLGEQTSLTSTGEKFMKHFR